MACPEQPDHSGHSVETPPPEIAEAFEAFAKAARLFAAQFSAQVMPTLENVAKALGEILKDLPKPAE